MSMNVAIIASREIFFEKKNGAQGQETQTIRFNAIQTPTEVTHKIIASLSPLASYKDFVKSLRQVELIPIFADDDLFGDGEPVGFQEYDWVEEHLKSLDAWIMNCEDHGFTISVEMV